MTPRLREKLIAVVNLGAEHARDDRQRRQQAIANGIALTAAAITLPYGVLYLALGAPAMAGAQVLCAGAFLAAVALTRDGRFGLARMWLVITVNASVFLVAGLLGADAGVHKIFVVTACMPLVLSDTTDRAYTASGVLLPLLLWLGLEVLGYDFGHRVALGTQVLAVVHLAMIPTTILGLLCQVWHFAAASQRTERSLEQLLTELTTANQAIKEETASRLQAEAELRQAHKLEAVGRLAAGVAHEINTPVQFVSDSVHFLREAADSMMGLVSRLQSVRTSVLEGAPCVDEAKEALAAEEDADLPYLTANIPGAFARCIDGLDRVATIVRSMKEFAHPDAAEMAEIDLNRSIESTLVIARSEYKYVAELETKLGALPPVLCNAGDINQAVLNIVVNAAHAIGDVVKGTEEKGVIQVQTRCEGDSVLISISDSGAGMPVEIRDRVFDPFFTTKGVGKGTGQGLAIARSVIVNEHGGALWFDTALGKGTTFFIRLPMKPALAAAA